MHLHGVVNDFNGSAGRGDLDHADVLACSLEADFIGHGSSEVAYLSILFDFNAGFSDHVAHRVLHGELAAKGHAIVGSEDHGSQSLLHLANGTHAMMNAARS